jgi:hypothetical protein
MTKMRIEPRRIEIMDPQMLAIWRKKSSAESLAIGLRMWDYGRQRMEASVRWQYPDWTDEQVKREVSRRFLAESRTALVPPGEGAKGATE